MVSIKWLNHAGYIVESNDVKLICDPWLNGKVFGNGWKLLIEHTHPSNTFTKASHIWISHEHPDHFNLNSLKHITSNIESERKPTLLFQKTKDGRVANYCEQKLGMKIEEIGEMERKRIGRANT